MFSKIMMPVDLAHADKLGKALRVAGDLARTHDAPICFVGVTTSIPSAIAHTPKEFGQKLDAFATARAEEYGITTTTKVIVSRDPSTQMNRELEALVREIGADLVVMATHLPNITDYVWSGHGAHMAAHSGASVFLVR